MRLILIINNQMIIKMMKVTTVNFIKFIMVKVHLAMFLARYLFYFLFDFVFGLFLIVITGPFSKKMH